MLRVKKPHKFIIYLRNFMSLSLDPVLKFLNLLFLLLREFLSIEYKPRWLLSIFHDLISWLECLHLRGHCRVSRGMNAKDVCQGFCLELEYVFKGPLPRNFVVVTILGVVGESICICLGRTIFGLLVRNLIVNTIFEFVVRHNFYLGILI